MASSSELPTKIAAHRGGAGLWPENSVEAFLNTSRLPLEFVECDVHPSRDGRLVIHHDPKLGRTTNGSGAICKQSWAQLSPVTLKGSDDARMPLLEQVIDIFEPTEIDLRVEIKTNSRGKRYKGLERRLANALIER